MRREPVHVLAERRGDAITIPGFEQEKDSLRR